MTLITLPMSALLSPSLPTMVLVLSATLTAPVATRAASAALLAISRMLADISSVPVATVWMFLFTCSTAAETTLACVEVSPALPVISLLTEESSSEALPSAVALSETMFTSSRMAVTSEAYLTTLKGLPLRSKIGLYEAWIQTSLPPLPMRLYSPAWKRPAASSDQKRWYSALAATAARRTCGGGAPSPRRGV